MAQKKCDYLKEDANPPCTATKEQCPKTRSKCRLSMLCYKVPVKP